MRKSNIVKCPDCKKPALGQELVADHIIPLSRGGKAYDPENIRWVHRSCHYKKAKWYKRLWQWFKRRVFRRIKQRHPLEVYYNGKLIKAGSGTIKTSVSEPTTITFDDPYK